MTKQRKRSFFKKPIVIFISLFISLLLIGLFLFYIISSQIKQIEEEQRLYKTYNYYYECNGELLDDECNYAKMTKGGTWISDCKSGKEYVCQNVVEIPK